MGSGAELSGYIRHARLTLGLAHLVLFKIDFPGAGKSLRRIRLIGGARASDPWRALLSATGSHLHLEAGLPRARNWTGRSTCLGATKRRARRALQVYYRTLKAMKSMQEASCNEHAVPIADACPVQPQPSDVDVTRCLKAPTTDIESTHQSTPRGRTPLFVPLPLRKLKPLDQHGFPNPPTKWGQAPPCTLANVDYLLDRYEVTARYDVIKKKVLITMLGHHGAEENFDNTALTHIISLAVLNGMQTGHLPAMVDALADRNQYNPVAEWIGSRPWDGTDRLPAFYDTLSTRPPFPERLKQALMPRWALSAVAAALKSSGFRTRGVLTLQGPQGAGKTQWAKSLVSDAALCRRVVKVDHHMDAQNKDSLVTAASHWIVEIGELDSSFKKDAARLKGFLTADQDKVRRPYARVDSEYPRRTVFCATVNDENFLIDSTGNTRFWTIPVLAIDHQHCIDMQQLFAQLAAAFESGEQWWLTDEEEVWLEEENKAFRVVSALRDRLLERLDIDAVPGAETPWRTASQVLAAAGVDPIGNAQARECAAILREIVGDPAKKQSQSWWKVVVREFDCDPMTLRMYPARR